MGINFGGKLLRPPSALLSWKTILKLFTAGAPCPEVQWTLARKDGSGLVRVGKKWRVYSAWNTV